MLADQPDENLANRLLRDGAQDVLLKSELECTPLARSVRYAIERQRRTAVTKRYGSVDGASVPQWAPAISAPADLPDELRELLLLQAGEVLNIQNHPSFREEHVAEEHRRMKTVMLAD